MTLGTIILTILGLCLFETVSSIDNAIVNAEVLSTMGRKAKSWFLLWGMLIAVFVVRGLLPWIIVWAFNPGLGPIGALTATFSNDPSVHKAIESSAPILLIGGGVFLLFLFLNWLFLEEKHFGLQHERLFKRFGIWFYATSSITLLVIVWAALKIDPLMAFGACVGSSAFFITQGFKMNAEANEEKLKEKRYTDIGKLFYLEVLDATFSIDGVLGAFAFTLSVPLIILGNGLGALVVRQLTIGNIERVKKYIFLKNGAMYSIMVLGIFMVIDSFGYDLPAWLSPLATFAIVGFFFLKSKKALKTLSLR